MLRASYCKQSMLLTNGGSGRKSVESLVGSAFGLLHYLANPVSLTQLKCVAFVALKRHPPFTNTAMPNLC